MLTPRFDGVLRGMVAARLGIEAICGYLGLSRSALYYNLIRLNLMTPHDRLRRQTSKRSGAWQDDQISAAIQWRVAGVHPESIGARLGNRSANAVRSKLRRLGVPSPPRKELRRYDPSQMPALTGFDFPLPPDDFDVVLPPASLRPSSSVTTFPAAANAKAPRLAKSPKAVSRKTPGQRELPILQAVSPGRATAPTAAPSAMVGLPAQGVVAPIASTPLPAPAILPTAGRALRASGQQALLPLPGTARWTLQAHRVISADEDISWVSKLSRILAHREAALVIADLKFSMLHRRLAAKRLGMSPTRFSTLLHKMDLPTDEDRSKFTDVFDPEVALKNWALSNGTFMQEPVRASGRPGNWFVRKKGLTDRTSLWTQRHVTKTIDREDYLRYRPRANFIPGTRSQQPMADKPQAAKGDPYEKLRIGGNAPPQRPGFPGFAGEPMPYAYAGNGCVPDGVAHP